MPKLKEPIVTPHSRKSGKGQRVGYVRVSTIEQNERRQLEGTELDRTFLDKASGKDIDRPQLAALLTFVREGDTVICHSMDRLGRNVDDLRKIVSGLTDRGVQVQFLKEGLSFTGEDSPMATLMMNVMGAVAQFERELIRERQREGIALAKVAGVYRGRKRALSSEQASELRRRLTAGEPKASLAREFGVDRVTVYRYMARGPVDAAEARGSLKKTHRHAAAKKREVSDVPESVANNAQSGKKTGRLKRGGK